MISILVLHLGIAVTLDVTHNPIYGIDGFTNYQEIHFYIVNVIMTRYDFLWARQVILNSVRTDLNLT